MHMEQKNEIIHWKEEVINIITQYEKLLTMIMLQKKT